MEEAIAGRKDMTKCIAYKTCKKTPDWSNDVTVPPPTTTTRPTTTKPTNQPPVTNGPVTNPPVTDGPPVTNSPPVTNDGEVPSPDPR